MIQTQHRIVSILYAVQGMIQGYLSRAEEGEFQDGEVRLTQAEAVLKRSLRQTTRILQITKRLRQLYEEKESGQLEAVCLEGSWRKILRKLENMNMLGGLELIEHIPSPGPVVCCNKTNLEEILYELAVNSIEAMKGKGKLILRVEYRYSEDKQVKVVITLADSGPGIPQAQLASLFHPFFTTKPEGLGNGLGLFLAHELVRKNGGRLTVSSSEGMGTSFSMEFSLSDINKPVSDRA